MIYPYCTIKDNIDVVYTPLNCDGQTLVHIEIPDAKYCFKTLDCLVPTYRASNIVGMSDDEVTYWVEFCRNNADILLTSAKQGGDF